MVSLAEETDRRRSIFRKGRKFNSVDMHVANRLRAARREAGLSQEKAAVHIKLTFQQVQKYENGTNRISCGKLAKLASVYGKPVAWFFEGVDVELATQARDLGAEMLAAPHGRDLATCYLAITDADSRDVLLTVAQALARIKT